MGASPVCRRFPGCSRAPGRGHARATVPSKTIAALGACTMERTGPCVRSEHQTADAHARTSRASAGARPGPR
jgi:hypothetical protein